MGLIKVQRIRKKRWTLLAHAYVLFGVPIQPEMFRDRSSDQGKSNPTHDIHLKITVFCSFEYLNKRYSYMHKYTAELHTNRSQFL